MAGRDAGAWVAQPLAAAAAATPVAPPDPALPPQPTHQAADADADLQQQQPFTFSSPFDAAAELRGARKTPAAAAAAAGPSAAAAGSLDRRPSGLRTSNSGRMPRTVSWSDLAGPNGAPLAEVVEYEPSERPSIVSEEEWGHDSSTSSPCPCCIQ